MTETTVTRLRLLIDERGHRVRYVNASPEARAKAEGIVK